MLQENVDLCAKWIDKLGSGEVTEEGYEDTFEGSGADRIAGAERPGVCYSDAAYAAMT